MPADGCSRLIFRQESVLQRIGIKPREPRGRFARRMQKIGNRVRLAQAPAVEIIAPAVGDDAALAKKSLELELLERQVRHCGDESAFVRNADHVRLIVQPFGSTVPTLKQIRSHESFGHRSYIRTRRSSAATADSRKSTPFLYL